MIFARFFRRNRTTGQLEERAASPAPAAPAAAPPPRPTAEEQAADLDTAVKMFEAIQEVMGEPDRALRLPSRVLLADLPEDLRGPAWKRGAFPDATLELDHDEVMKGLRVGRVVCPLSQLLKHLPPGWVKADPESVVELSLREIVSALPPEMLRGATKLSDDMIEVAGMKDYFAPKAAPKPAAPAPTPVPAAPAAAPAPAAPRRPGLPAAVPGAAKKRPKPVPPPGTWDGVERQPDAGARSVDVNTADEAALEALPGVGAHRARLILEWRKAHGPFAGVFDLVDIPGIGRRIFIHMTGLQPAVTKRRDRHEALNALLGLPPNARPSLVQIAEETERRLGAAGFVLTGLDGVVLAKSPSLGEEADRYGALAPRIFRRTRRYLRRLCEGPVSTMVLPTASPPLLLASSASFCVVLALKPDTDLKAAIGDVGKIAAELDWLLGPRAVVRA